MYYAMEIEKIKKEILNDWYFIEALKDRMDFDDLERRIDILEKGD